MKKKKLQLKRETLRQLTDDETRGAAGGAATWSSDGCNWSEDSCCTKTRGCGV